VFVRRQAQWSQQAYLKASNTESLDAFGRSSLALSADGNTLAVGAQREDSDAVDVDGDQNNNDAKDSGAVYVFTREATQWSRQAYLKASNTNPGDEFGFAFALSADGNTLAVGAFGEDSNAVGVNNDGGNNDATNSGAVYVFTRDGAQWLQQAYLKASNTETRDLFGGAVALSADGHTLAIGATGEDSAAISAGGGESNNDAPNSGAAYVFTREGMQWSQQAYVKASNAEASDTFGRSLALSADARLLAGGAMTECSATIGVNGNENDNAALGSGAVYTFPRTGPSWLQQAYVKASNTVASDFFGFAVALSADGDILAVAAPIEQSDATGLGGDQANNNADKAGAVYIY